MTVFGEGFIRVRPDVHGFSHEAKEGVLGPVKEIAKGVAGIFAVAGSVEFLKGSVEKAEAATRATDSLKVSLENQKVSWEENSGAIEKWVQATSRTTAFHTTDLTQGLSRLFTATGSVAKSEKDLSIAADIARLKHIDLAAGVNLVVGATAGNTRALRQMGIIMSPVTAAQDELKKKISNVKDGLHLQEESYKSTAKTQKLSSDVVNHHIDALKASAKAQIDDLKAQAPAAAVLDKQATGVKLLDELKRRAAGQSKEYANSEGGAVDRLKNSFDQIQIAIGKDLLPVLANLASAGSAYIDKFRAHWPVLKAEILATIEPLRPVFDAIKSSIELVNGALGGTGQTLKDIGIAIAAFVVISKTIQLVTLIYEGLTVAIFLARNAQIAFNVAMEGNAIGIVIIAIAALAAGIYLAYQRSATFRAIVQDAFAILRTYVLPVLVETQQAVTSFVNVVRAHWDQITGFVGPVVKGAFNVARIEVQTFVQQVENIVNLFGDVLHGRWGNIWNDLKALVTTPLNGVKDIVGTILDTLQTIAGDKADQVATAIVRGIKAAPGKLEGLAGDLFGKVSSAVSDTAKRAYTAALDIGAQLVHGIVQGIENTPANIGSSLWGVVSGGVSAVRKAAKVNSPSLYAAEMIGMPLVEGIIHGTKTLGKDLAASLISNVTSAVTQAKGSLQGLASSVAGSINSIIDAATSRAIANIPQTLSAAVAGLGIGATLGAASDKIAADQAARQKRNLEQALSKAIDAAKTGPAADGTGPSQADLDQAQKDAQIDLDDFLLQQQIDTDTKSYNARVKLANDTATVAKQSVTDQIALWTQQFNAGLISQATYLADINSLVNQYATGDGATAWAQAGDLLGGAFVSTFQGQLNTLIAQINAITAAGQGVGGDGTLGSITNPSGDVVSRLKSAIGTLAGDTSSTAKAKAAVVKAQQRFNEAHDVGSTIAAAGGSKSAIDAMRTTEQQLKAAKAQEAAAESGQKRDAAIVEMLRAILKQAGIDPDAAIAAATR